MAEPIFMSSYFIEYVLPFVLVFTIVFAILQKTKLFGENVKQINAIVGFVSGLILIVFPFSRNIVVVMMPFLAVSAVILMVFMMLYAFVWGKSGNDLMHKGVKIAVSIILGVFLIAVFLSVTGWWKIVYDYVINNVRDSAIWVNAIMIIVIGVFIIIVVKGDKGNGSNGNTD